MGVRLFLTLNFPKAYINILLKTGRLGGACFCIPVELNQS